MAGEKVTEFSTEEEFKNYVASFPDSALLVLYFHAPWAAPCKQMSTVLDALASTYPVQTPPTVGFVSLNAEEVPDVSEAYDVSAVPYIVLQKGGETIETVSGSDAARVRAAVEKHASGQTGNAGKLGIPPAQTVTRTESSGGPVTNGTNGAADLSAYAPGANDPATAPEFSSGQADKEALFKRLDELTKAAPVMLFMKGTPSSPQCGFSRQLVAMLRERSIRYGFFNILADDDVRQGLKEYADWPTFPQLWVDGELIGGLDIVREEFENNADFMKEYSVAPKAAAASS